MQYNALMTPRDHLLVRLGARIRDHRTAKGLSQKALCGAAGVSPRFLVMLERGEGNPSVLRLFDLAQALGVSLSQLMAELDAAPAAPIVSLVGLRGAGKSTIGARAATELGWEFVELGREIEALAGMSTGEVFEFHGDVHYRELAIEALRGVLERGAPVVVEVGGSLVLDPMVLNLLLERTHMIWLRATPEQHLARVRSQGDLRPMAGRGDALGELRDILAARAPLYAQAPQVIDTVTSGLEQAVAHVVAGAAR